MPITLENATLLSLDPPGVMSGALRIENDSVSAIGPMVKPSPGDEVVDCGGAVVLPGLVNGHTHLYSALATGMPPPSRAPKNFHEILELIWWRLDRAHDAESIELCGLIGALDAVHCGTTTLIDHHASPNSIEDSLDNLERGIAAVGLRAVLCYETTDRNGAAGALAGLEENRRYLERCAQRNDGRFAALVGAHAAFTMSDETLSACARLAAEYHSGVHIHVAEDPCDDRLCREKYGAPLVERLTRSGLVDESVGVAARSILAHCTHLSQADAKRLSRMVAAVAHNPRSNMNNQVGYAPTNHLSGVQLGTDGIGSDMFAEARAAWFKSRDACAGLAPTDIVEMLVRSARTASRLLGKELGQFAPGAAADVVVTDYIPATPLSPDNIVGHLIFALASHHVRHVLVAGQWTLRDRQVLTVAENETRRRAVDATRALWSRMPRA